MWIIIQIALAILYFAHLPALAAVPAFVFFIPLIIAGSVFAFFGFVLMLAMIVAALQ